MESQTGPCILTVNSGSSSLKFKMFELGPAPTVQASGQIERIGGQARFRATIDSAQTLDQSIDAATHEQAVHALLTHLESTIGSGAIAAIGHRVVHGGERFVESCLIDDAVVAGLREVAALAPTHMPGALAAIDAFRMALPDHPQVACFDTAFHRHLPEVASRLPLPREFDALGLRRYGFHGLSYQYLMGELERQAGLEAAHARVVLAHLGAGSSLAAVKNGACVQTTMGFTPAAGLMMANRTGDLDPGVLIHLVRHRKLSASELEDLVNRQSGLLGVSGRSGDVRDLLAVESTDPAARTALEMLCDSIRGWIARMAASLEGIDTLVFSAGIGENSAVIREWVCSRLRWLGIELDPAKNSCNEPVISTARSVVRVRVIKTNEELMIFRETCRLTRLQAS